jgi:hypothetical protein
MNTNENKNESLHHVETNGDFVNGAFHHKTEHRILADDEISVCLPQFSGSPSVVPPSIFKNVRSETVEPE